METSITNTSYRDWRSAVNAQLVKTYCITIEDAGFDEAYLTRHWRLNETAIEFVDWFGNKYDLDRLESSVRA